MPQTGQLKQHIFLTVLEVKFKVPGGLMSPSGLHADDHLSLGPHTRPSRCTNVERSAFFPHISQTVALQVQGFSL